MEKSLSVRFLHSLLFFLAMKLSYSDEQKDHFIYNGFHDDNMSLNGIALIHPDGLLQLTNVSHQQIGRALYRYPIEFGNSSDGRDPLSSFSFSTSFVFSILPEEHRKNSGHGLAFTISPSIDFPGAMETQYLGLFNISNDGKSSNHVFAVELDTMRSVEFGDVDGNHVGIDVNSLRSNESAPAAYYDNKDGKNKSLDLLSGDVMQVWIDFNGVENQLNVTISPLHTPKPNIPLLSYNVDLSSIFMNSMYVGFSSATGAVASSHYILGWSFKLNGRAEKINISRLPPIPRRRESGVNRRLQIGLSLAAVVLSLMVISGSIYVMRRKKYEEIREDWEQEYGPHRFSFKDLSIATKDFGDKKLLGVGGFGRVYQGVLPASDVQVAVKRVSHDSKQGMKEFVAEITSIGRLRHRNLVQLLGYCRRKGELLLVYDFMPNGSLDKFLFTDENPVLDWHRRFRILQGVAYGLLYLHEEWEQVVLHRDVKASNVLLDADLNGRMGDFGLARLYDHGTNPQTTHVVGTFGYLAPEMTRTGKATTHTDVFAFGALMLEVACGRRPIEPRASTDRVILVEWVWDCWRRGAIIEAADPKLGNDYAVDELELVLKLGLLCSHLVPAVRPSMRQVTQFLDGNLILPDLPSDGLDPSVLDVEQGPNEGFDELCMSYPSSLEGGLLNSSSVTESVLSGGR